MEVLSGLNKMRDQKTGMAVIPRCLNLFVESCYARRRLFPRARVRSGGTVIKVVIDHNRRLLLFDLRSVQRYEAAGPCVDDIVLKDIVRHVPLHLELTGLGSRGIVVVERVVDHRGVLGASSLRRITSDGNACGMAVIDKVIPRSDITGGAVQVLTGELDSEVHIMNDVLFDQDSGAAVHVNTIGRFVIAVCRIAARGNAVNQIAAYYSVAGLVDSRVGCRALKTDDVDSDVVVVVDNIVSNAEVRDVPVHYQRLTRTGFEVMHLIAVNNQFTDRSLGVGTVYRNAKPVAASSRSITPIKSLLNMMDVVLQQFYMGADPHNTYAQWSQPMFGCAVVANFKAFDSDVTLVMNGQYGASAIRSKMFCVEDGRLAGIASKNNVSISRVAGCLDAYELFVDSTPHVDGTARARGVCGMLNGAPRRHLGAGIRIISSRRHVEGGVGLVKSAGDARK